MKKENTGGLLPSKKVLVGESGLDCLFHVHTNYRDTAKPGKIFADFHYEWQGLENGIVKVTDLVEIDGMFVPKNYGTKKK